jgi:hypothetical protein
MSRPISERMTLSALEELVALQRFMARHDFDTPATSLAELRQIRASHGYLKDTIPDLIHEAITVYRRLTESFGPLSSSDFNRDLAIRRTLERERGVSNVYALLVSRANARGNKLSTLRTSPDSAFRNIDSDKLVAAIEARMALAHDQAVAASENKNSSAATGWLCQYEGLEIARNMIQSGAFDR